METSISNQFLNIVNIEARDLPEAWFLCLKECLNKGYEYVIDKGSFAGQKRKEFDFVTIRIKYPGSRPLIPDTPLGIPIPTSMEYIEKYLPYIMIGSNIKKENEEYTYGEDIEPQMNKIISILKNEGFNTNQTCITIGNKTSILLDNPQCLKVIDVRVRYNKLHFIVYFRSWDLWGGFPANLAAIQIMKEYMGSELSVEDGELIACSKGLHLYDHHWELAKKVIYR